VRLRRILGDDDQPRARLDERSLVVGILPQRAGADDDHDVEGRERLAQARAARGKVPGEARMVLREPGGAAERLLPDRAAQALGQRDEPGPAGGAVGARAGHQRHGRRAVDQRRQLLDDVRVRAGAAQQPPRTEDLVGGGLGGGPVVHRDDHDRGAASGLRLPVGAHDRPRHVLAAHRLVDPHGVVAGEALQAAGQERVLRQVPPVLLAHQHDQRRPVLPRGGDGRDRVAEPRRRVQQRERGRAAAERVPGGHPDDRALVQSQHELEVVGQAGQERHLGGPGIGEQRRQPKPAQDVEGRVADGAPGRPGRSRRGGLLSGRDVHEAGPYCKSFGDLRPRLRRRPRTP
jgi:hypothetical protein